MPQIDEPTTSGPKPAVEARKPKPAAEKTATGLYAFTVDTANGKVVMIEKVDGTSRQPLSAEEKAQLAKQHGAMPLRQLIEQAFEAGIECVLGDGGGTKSPESERESELSGVVLQSLIEGTNARELIQPATLDRTIISSLFSHAATTVGPVGQ